MLLYVKALVLASAVGVGTHCRFLFVMPCKMLVKITLGTKSAAAALDSALKRLCVRQNVFVVVRFQSERFIAHLTNKGWPIWTVHCGFVLRSQLRAGKRLCAPRFRARKVIIFSMHAAFMSVSIGSSSKFPHTSPDSARFVLCVNVLMVPELNPAGKNLSTALLYTRIPHDFAPRFTHPVPRPSPSRTCAVCCCEYLVAELD